MALVAQSFHWVRNPDNTLDGAYPAGDKPPAVEDLAWNTAALEAALTGINNQVTGAPFSADVRAALTGTNAASATITFVNATGDDPTTEGWVAPGSGDDLTHDGGEDGSGTVQLRATYSGESVDSGSIAWVYQAVAVDRNVFWYADFETGAIQGHANAHDGCFIMTLPEPQSDPNDGVSSTSGGFGPATSYDLRVVASEVVGAETVTPRAGSYFCRSKIYFDKRYESLNAATYPNDTLNKPRMQLAPKYFSSPTYVFDWDQEVWVGFSIYLPLNWEHELGVKDHRGGVHFFYLNPKANATHMVIGIYVPSGQTTAHWMVQKYVSATSTKESGATSDWSSIGSVTPDLGKWTDFVLRYRANPFTTTTNANTISGGKNQVYEGNKGILQLWKGEGAVGGGGNRTMSLKIDIENAPVGLVPQTANPYLHTRLDMYKYNWHISPTTVDGPIWMGFDEYRWGRALLDGTGFSDVSPSGLGAP